MKIETGEMMAKKKPCACALVNGHLSGCPYRNQIVSHEIDFSSLAKMLKEMEKTVSKESSKPLRKRKRIFVAPVLRKKEK